MREKLVLIDGHSILNRAFYGVPDLTNSSGLHTNAVYGFLNILFRLLDEEKPDYLVVAFDEHAPTFRHQMYEAYKGTRKPMPEELRQQVPVLRELLSAMEVTTISRPGLEADDILGTLAKKSQAAGMEVRLVSGDRDLLQIADEHICIRIPRTKGGKTTIDDFYSEQVKETYQVTPKQFIELKALMGDTADNIPGVPKVGEKTATELIVNYGSIEGIYEHISEISKKSIRESLENNRDLADLSLALATIKIDCDIELDREASKAEGYFTTAAYEMMKKLEFRNFFDRFEASAKKTESVKIVPEDISDTDVFLKKLENLMGSGRIGLAFAMEQDAILGIVAVSGDTGVSYMGSIFGDAVFLANLKELFGKASECEVDTCNIKPMYDILHETDTNRLFDCLLGAYLLNPLKNDYDAEAVAGEHLGQTIPGQKELFGKMSLSDAAMGSPDVLARYLTDQAIVAYESTPVLRKKLGETGMDKLMTEVEMPLSKVLYDMEREGILVRKDELEQFSRDLGTRIAELENSIRQQAGMEFNINSPKQLGEILFEKMQIPGGKKTKTGYSTAADVLEKLAPEYPFVADILEYRGLTKLKSTYADALPGFIREDGRIHSSFHQMVTATGRISSSDPNLQNIPIRTELGRELRKVFVAKPGYTLVDADYSQIELRVLASLSGDRQLIEAYASEQDIHRITASKVFHIPFEEVTDQQRRNAKAVNFGIVYGISSFGLSQDLSITPKEAKAYIDQYFETYPGIRDYLQKLVSDAKELGYTRTYFGRRRPIPELKSANFMQRSFGERVAMNAPIQGTAADIIKIAMIRVAKELQERNLKSRLILQVHDELLVETAEDEIEIVKELLVRNMQSAVELPVKLEVGMETGESWYDAH